MATGPFVCERRDVIWLVSSRANVRAANVHRNEGAHAGYYTGAMQRRQWLAWVRYLCDCYPGFINLRLFMFPNLVDKPGQFLNLFSFGVPVYDCEDQEQIPILDGIQQILKVLKIVMPIAPELLPKGEILIVILNDVKQVGIICKLARKCPG